MYFSCSPQTTKINTLGPKDDGNNTTNYSHFLSLYIYIGRGREVVRRIFFVVVFFLHTHMLCT